MDRLCNDALAILYPDPKQSTGHDLLETLLDSLHPASVAFIQHVSLPPPPSVTATPDSLVVSGSSTRFRSCAHSFILPSSEDLLGAFWSWFFYCLVLI
jgi:hypothetical protein